MKLYVENAKIFLHVFFQEVLCLDVNFMDPKYRELREAIESEFSVSGGDHQSALTFLLSDDFIQGMCFVQKRKLPEISKDLVVNCVNFVYEKLNSRTKMTKLKHNRKPSNATLHNHTGSSWKTYSYNLEKKKFPEEEIEKIGNSSLEIVQMLELETEQPVKGLVVGNVQSGKTASMAGVMAIAADNGFNFFILLSGVIDSLRQQTRSRIFYDLANGDSNCNWIELDHLSPVTTKPSQRISNLNLNPNSYNRYFTVVLKNKTRLEDLLNWLAQDEDKAGQMNVIIIDDEADQASLNTNDIENDDPSTINKLIKKLVNEQQFKSVNYIAYTATPFGNVLNEVGSDSLYPSDFITLLEPSDDYIGMTKIFGVSEPEQASAIDYLMEISEQDMEQVDSLNELELSPDEMPNSFKESLRWFIICVAALRFLGRKQPISMLIHTSHTIISHHFLEINVKNYLEYLREDVDRSLNQMEDDYRRNRVNFPRNKFIQGMPNYSRPDEVPEYPDWQHVKDHIKSLLIDNAPYYSSILLDDIGVPTYHKGFHIVVDNSKSANTRLVYPENPSVSGSAFIVIGGNTLSRGLTLEGLISSYFVRKTNQSDTLIQMGRWFGYRHGYEIFPRIWLNKLAQNRFNFLAQMNEDFREEIRLYAKNGLTPLDYQPRVKNSPSQRLVKITSSNKMQSAKQIQFNFSGYQAQTIFFKNDLTTLNHNLELTSSFLNDLQTPEYEVGANHLIWREVNNKKVKEYLEGYLTVEGDSRFNALPALTEWLEQNNENLDGWNVVLRGKNLAKDNRQSNFNIHGYSVDGVIRSRLIERSNDQIVSIGALRQPDDLIVDIEGIDEEQRKLNTTGRIDLRLEKGLSATPLLVIYKIDKVSKPNSNNGRREAMNFDQDIIGMFILIPSFTRRGAFAEFVVAEVDADVLYNSYGMEKEDSYGE